MKKKKGSLNNVDIDYEVLMGVDPFNIGMDAGSFTPLTDIVETDGFFIIEVELAGVKKEDLVIEIRDNYIYLSGKKENEKKTDTKRKYHCMNRSYGVFKRVFEIPKTFNIHGVKAKLENGLLTIKLPKIEDKRKKRIKIEVE